MRVAGLNNRVPNAVLLLEVIGAALGVALLAFYLSVLGRGLLTVLLAAGLVTMLLYVTFDLDRPTRGLITVPSTPLVAGGRREPAAGGERPSRQAVTTSARAGGRPPAASSPSPSGPG